LLKLLLLAYISFTVSASFKGEGSVKWPFCDIQEGLNPHVFHSLRIYGNKIPDFSDSSDTDSVPNSQFDFSGNRFILLVKELLCIKFSKIYVFLKARLDSLCQKKNFSYPKIYKVFRKISNHENCRLTIFFARSFFLSLVDDNSSQKKTESQLFEKKKKKLESSWFSQALLIFEKSSGFFFLTL